jgi:hypothetical protein
VKNSVYALPNSPQAREDFEWIKSEVLAMKGEATVFAADSVDSLSEDEMIAAFRRARQEDFDEIRSQAEKLQGKVGRKRPITRPVRRHLAHRTQLLRKHWNQIASIDFFGAPGRDEAAAALGDLEQLLTEQSPAAEKSSAKGENLKPHGFRDQLWVTRPRPGIDRMASAWLIRRFIDPGAKFGFVERADDVPSAIPFDMFGVEFGHQGNNCTFETLTNRFGLKNPVLEWLGKIVHNLDLKDDKHTAPEAPAIGLLVEGLRHLFSDDQELLERGITMFEAMYRSSAANPPPTRKPRKATARPRRKVLRKKRKT